MTQITYEEYLKKFPENTTPPVLLADRQNGWGEDDYIYDLDEYFDEGNKEKLFYGCKLLKPDLRLVSICEYIIDSVLENQHPSNYDNVDKDSLFNVLNAVVPDWLKKQDIQTWIPDRTILIDEDCEGD